MTSSLTNRSKSAPTRGASQEHPALDLVSLAWPILERHTVHGIRLRVDLRNFLTTTPHELQSGPLVSANEAAGIRMRLATEAAAGRSTQRGRTLQRATCIWMAVGLGMQVYELARATEGGSGNGIADWRLTDVTERQLID